MVIDRVSGKIQRGFLFVIVVSFAFGCNFPVSAKGNTDDVGKKDSETITSEETQEQADAEDQYADLTLENIFPEKSFFGPTAKNMSFSHDGKYGAYLYRPYKERRHGSDLWIYDTDAGSSERITSVSVMARFQENTRKVKEARIKKAKEDKSNKAKKKSDADKDGNNDKSDEDSDGNTTEDVDADEGQVEDNEKEQKENGDWVSDADADDKSGPKYSGVTSLTWSPCGHQLLFVSEGDIYQYCLDDKEITRLTKTAGAETNVKWLHDGNGYTYQSGGRLFKVIFGRHLIEQISPKFESGYSMAGYEISPDGEKIAFTARKWGPAPQGSGRKVKIANYRDRFMKTSEHRRQLAEDPTRSWELGVYLYQVTDTLTEEATLSRVFKGTFDKPRDYVSGPAWSPDSTKIVFCAYEQENGDVKFYEAKCEYLENEKKADVKKGKLPKTDSDSEGSSKKDNAENAENLLSGQNDPDKQEDKEEKIEFKPAEMIYRFVHTGGPTTPNMIAPEYLSDNRRIAYLSEQTGFRHIHILDPLYQSTVPITTGRYEVYPVKMAKDRSWMVVTATKEHPARADIYKITFDDNAMTKISLKPGRYTSVAVSDDGGKVMAIQSQYGRLWELVSIDSQASTQSVLTDSHPEKAKKHTRAKPTFFDFKNRHGHDIYGQLFKPDDWEATDKRPMLLFLYGGPLGKTKQVLEGNYQGSSYFFAYYMAKKHGYVTCTIDPRGNSGYGALFEKSNYERVGKPQVEDVLDAVDYFIDTHGVDPNRIAIHGWSFGGFQTQMCLYTEPNVFAAGIAGAGPTEWENYNAWYTTGTIASEKLEKFSLLPLAKNLKAKLLLVHGVEDANVLYQDTVRIYRELLKEGKETLVELFIDPTGGHGLGGDVKSLGRFRKYEDFLLRTVGDEKTAKGNRGNSAER